MQSNLLVDRYLEYIIVGGVEGRLLNPRSLQRTGASLKRPDLRPANDDQVYSNTELKHLLDHCPNLRELCLALGNMNNVVNDLGGPCVLCKMSDFSELEDSLVSSSIPESYNQFERRWQYTQIAEQIMQCLAKYENKIWHLGFTPSKGQRENSRPDQDGNLWPFYNYRRGTLSVTTANAPHSSQATAVPFRHHKGGSHVCLHHIRKDASDYAR